MTQSTSTPNQTQQMTPTNSTPPTEPNAHQVTSNPDRAAGGRCSQSTCSADFVMPFGKYKGQTLDQISNNDPGYVVWLADENVLKIEREFLEAVLESVSEMRDIINGHAHDIY
jgi:uncharacterized protein (DUF3820 family)